MEVLAWVKGLFVEPQRETRYFLDTGVGGCIVSGQETVVQKTGKVSCTSCVNTTFFNQEHMFINRAAGALSIPENEVREALQSGKRVYYTPPPRQKTP